MKHDWNIFVLYILENLEKLHCNMCSDVIVEITAVTFVWFVNWICDLITELRPFEYPELSLIVETLKEGVPQWFYKAFCSLPNWQVKLSSEVCLLYLASAKLAIDNLILRSRNTAIAPAQIPVTTVKLPEENVHCQIAHTCSLWQLLSWGLPSSVRHLSTPLPQ